MNRESEVANQIEPIRQMEAEQSKTEEQILSELETRLAELKAKLGEIDEVKRQTFKKEQCDCIAICEDARKRFGDDERKREERVSNFIGNRSFLRSGYKKYENPAARAKLMEQYGQFRAEYDLDALESEQNEKSDRLKIMKKEIGEREEKKAKEERLKKFSEERDRLMLGLYEAIDEIESSIDGIAKFGMNPDVAMKEQSYDISRKYYRLQYAYETLLKMKEPKDVRWTDSETIGAGMKEIGETFDPETSDLVLHL
ncbi:MAG: hypothetical protein HGA31_05650 [Candidatus Moranbacteria bacterium]|nr:hypothetical protein [Candidatus Moranbacteria bacterium]